jgi:hypothetical protein
MTRWTDISRWISKRSRYEKFCPKDIKMIKRTCIDLVLFEARNDDNGQNASKIIVVGEPIENIRLENFSVRILERSPEGFEEGTLSRWTCC